MSDIHGATVLITGAASGIGRATALELSKRGGRLLLVDRDGPGMQALSEAITRAGHPGAVLDSRVVDLADPAQVDSLVPWAADGGVDVLINNAGICVVAPVEQTPMSDFDRLLAVNLRAVIQLTQGLLPMMLARGRGHVVNIASISGLIGVPGFVAYGTTKYAVVGYSEALRNELRDRGIKVTCVCPNIVNTPLKQNLTLRGYDESLRDKVPGASPSGVATQVVDAISRERALIVPAGSLIALMMRWFPHATRLAISRLKARVLEPNRR